METQARSGMTGTLGFANLGVGNGSALGVALATTFAYAIRGVAFSKTGAATDIPLTAGLGSQAAGTSCLYLVQISSGGTVSFKKGNEVATANAGQSLQCPSPDADRCPVGYVRIDNNTASPFVCGTTALTATDIVDTYVNFGGGMASGYWTSGAGLVGGTPST